MNSTDFVAILLVIIDSAASWKKKKNHIGPHYLSLKA